MLDEDEFLAGPLKGLEAKYEKELEGDWEGSPYAWILKYPSGTKGAIARDVVWLWSVGSQVFFDRENIRGQPCFRSDDMVFQVKSSTLWNRNKYRFQQFRKVHFDYTILLGIAPFDLHLWIVPREEIETYIIGSHGQHTGSGAAETDWYEVDPYNPPAWLEPWGGTREAARRVLEKIK